MMIFEDTSRKVNPGSFNYVSFCLRVSD